MDLLPGYEVTVVGSTKVLVLVPLTFAEFDPATDPVEGTAPVGAVVRLNGGNESDGFEVDVVADGSGFWSVDLLAEHGFDLTFDIGAEARVFDEDGDSTSVGNPQNG